MPKPLFLWRGKCDGCGERAALAPIFLNRRPPMMLCAACYLEPPDLSWWREYIELFLLVGIGLPVLLSLGYYLFFVWCLL